MPWKEREEEVRRFVTLGSEPGANISALARNFFISRQTAYKWLKRFKLQGFAGCEERSRRPLRSPTATSRKTIDRLLALKRKHPTWGAKKLLVLMAANRDATLPSVSTANSILKRHGLVVPPIKRRPGHPSVFPRRLTVGRRPNELWCIDFKGEFKMKDGRYCWPLTVTDASTRYLLACVGMHRIDGQRVNSILDALFRKYGLPECIRTDNGSPFAAHGLWGLTHVSVHWARHGIRIERIRKGKPQDNGRHERFHRTLKEATSIPPEANLRAQQRAFDKFQSEYNHVRPHESLRMKRPADLYVASPRRPGRTDHQYPPHFQVIRGNDAGHVVIESQKFFIGTWARREAFGLEEIAYRKFRMHFGTIALCELHVATGKVVPYGPKGTKGRRSTIESRRLRCA